MEEGSSYRTPAQVKAGKRWWEDQKQRAEREAERKIRAAIRDAKIENANELGNFVISRFERNHAMMDFSREIRARLAYLATFVNYEGQLMLAPTKPMTRESLQKVMLLSDSTFYRFVKEIHSKGILKIETDGRLLLSSDSYYKGYVPPATGYEDGWIKIFVEAMRKLYELTPTNKHGSLGAMFCMVPFVNRKYNILCNNPLEEDIEAVRASTIGMKEFLSLLGMDSSNAKRYRDFYKNISIPLDGNDHKFCTIVPRDDETELIIINPRLMFAGDDWQYVESLMLLFSQNGAKAEIPIERKIG